MRRGVFAMPHLRLDSILEAIPFWAIGCLPRDLLRLCVVSSLKSAEISDKFSVVVVFVQAYLPNAPRQFLLCRLILCDINLVRIRYYWPHISSGCMDRANRALSDSDRSHEFLLGSRESIGQVTVGATTFRDGAARGH